MKKELWLLFACGAMIVACAAEKLREANPPSTPDTPPVVEQPKEFKDGWYYDSLVESKLTPQMLAASPGRLCKDKNIDRKVFWKAYMKAVSWAETKWVYTSTYVEKGFKNLDPVTGKQPVSEGLFQLSYQDVKWYAKQPTCQLFDYKADEKLPLKNHSIINPFINVGCAMEIADKLMTSYAGNELYYIIGRYWSVSRPERDGWARMTTQLYKDLPQCK